MGSKQTGMSLVEVLVSLLIISLMIFGMLRFTDAAFSMTRRNMDKQFAAQKAISMLEELKSLVQVQGESASLLDAYDDGTAFNPVLTTDPKIMNPADPVSANSSLGADQWKYVRLISVTSLPGTTAPDVRLVRVRVCLNRDADDDGQPDPLAEIAGVVRTPAGNYPPTQVYDVYALAVENVPGWWVYMANLIPFVQSAIQNLQTRNPGMELRVHWITELSYGRDRQYRPQINSAVDSRQPIGKVYFYPGKLPAGEAVGYYYPPNNFKGHVLVDATDTNGYDAVNNPHPYALADNYNNALRYPDELALFDARVASGQEKDDAPTLRILLERLYQNPERFRNAIFINLHGELFPFPPIRNYSDPAKDPARYPSIRAVTHPERLKYPSGAAVRLRVYSYIMDPGQLALGPPHPDWLGQNDPAEKPIAVTLKDVNWDPAPGSGDVVAITGGTDQDGAAGPDAYGRMFATTAPPVTGAMYYRVTHTGNDTVLWLYNSPLKSPEVSVGGGACPAGSACTGLNATSRLYGLEYIPAPAEDFTTLPPPEFSVDLTATHTKDSGGVCASGECEPNTARWVITIPADRLPGGAGGNGVLRVETSIDPPSAGASAPSNLSATYVWRGGDVWLFGDGTPANPPHLPITETYQVIGDPRHNPYADLKKPHPGSGHIQQDRLGLGYNRYFDDFEAGGAASFNAAGPPNWKGYNYTVLGQNYGVKNDGAADNDGWDTHMGYVEVDLNRIYQIMRTVLTRAHAVYTAMTGYSYYYVGLGGEIGYDAANNFPSSIPINSELFTGVPGSTYEQSILPGAGAGVKYIRENTSAGSPWWGLYWLGELYPDSAYDLSGLGWAATGNLPTGVGAGRFVRVTRDSITANLPRGTKFINVGHRTGPPGSTSYFWTGTAPSTFHHIPSNGAGNLQAGGQEIASRYSYPLSNGIPINRPFAYNVNATGDNPDHFLQPIYGPIFNSGYLSLFYNHSVQTTEEGSALLSVADSNNDVQFVVVNGISMTGESGSSFMANWSMLTLMHGFFAAGLYNPTHNYENHVQQLPRIAITSPDLGTDLRNPASVTVGWSREWRRWDGQTYTPGYPPTFAENSALSYAVMYSADNGVTWKYMQDDSSARPGVRPGDPSRLISTPAPDPTYSWATPASRFPLGTYLIRVEAYRDDLPLHYAYHQLRLFIRRSY